LHKEEKRSFRSCCCGLLRRTRKRVRRRLIGGCYALQYTRKSKLGWVAETAFSFPSFCRVSVEDKGSYVATSQHAVGCSLCSTGVRVQAAKSPMIDALLAWSGLTEPERGRSSIDRMSDASRGLSLRRGGYLMSESRAKSGRYAGEIIRPPFGGRG
jgi:hypothetical protein